MDRRPPDLPNLPGQAPRPQLPPLPPLDRSAPPPAAQQSPQQLTGPQKLDSMGAKGAVQRSMVDSIIPVRLSVLLPCAVHPCLNYTNTAQVSYDITYQMYRISVVCPECQKNPRP